MRSTKLSDLQKASLYECLKVGTTGWHRSRTSGERVTLASLYRLGLVERRAWDGVDGEPNAAYEYRATTQVREIWSETEKKG